MFPKKRTHGYRGGIVLLVAGALLVLSPWAMAEAQKGDNGHSMGDQQASQKKHCEAMAEKHKAMKENMSAMNAHLKEQVSKVDALSGEAKVEALASLVETMIEQRQSMQQMMMKRHSGMMGHMMGHMGEGMMGGGKGAKMEMCPMMREMHSSEAPEEEGSAHSEHHPG